MKAALCMFHHRQKHRWWGLEGAGLLHDCNPPTCLFPLNSTRHHHGRTCVKAWTWNCIQVLLFFMLMLFNVTFILLLLCHFSFVGHPKSFGGPQAAHGPYVVQVWSTYLWSKPMFTTSQNYFITHLPSFLTYVMIVLKHPTFFFLFYSDFNFFQNFCKYLIKTGCTKFNSNFSVSRIQWQFLNMHVKYSLQWLIMHPSQRYLHKYTNLYNHLWIRQD